MSGSRSRQLSLRFPRRGAFAVGTPIAGRLRVARIGHLLPAPTERSVPISGTTLVRSRFRIQRHKDGYRSAGNRDTYDEGVNGQRASAVSAPINGLADAVATNKDERLKALGKQWRSLAAILPLSFV